MGFMSNHQSWAFAFGILGNIISFLVFLAPVPTFYRIYKKKSTESFQSLPYQVALFSSMLWLYYALLKADAFLLVTINSFGCVVETIYIALFLSYASKDSRLSAIKLFSSMNMGLFASILILIQFLVRDAENRVVVLGWICVAVSVSVFAAPLSIVARVVRTKSVEFMPFTLSLFLTTSAVMWFAYGMFMKDLCVALPNVLGFVLGMLQMLLYGIYRNTEKAAEEKKPPENLKNVVVLNNLGASEVYLVEVGGGDTKECKKEHGETEEETGEAEVKVAISSNVQPIECAV